MTGVSMRIRSATNRRPEGLVVLGLWSLAFAALFYLLPAGTSADPDPVSRRAVGLMTRSIAAIREYREAAGPPIDPYTDINRTGLIGIEASPITTSVGRLEAKRTTTNPYFAGALVRMFREAGLKPGDTVAIGASDSFPALVLATLCAAEALKLDPLLLPSLGASNWGANDPAWTWLEIAGCLREKGLLDVVPIGLSIGGDKDSGADMSEEGPDLLTRKIRETGRPFIREPDLAKNIAARLALFEASAKGKPIKAFVNVGGSYADMGTDGEILKLKPGFNPASTVAIPPVERRGLIQEMARRGVPVIHLLFVKGLCDRYGLPWDPVPLPAPDAADSPSGFSRPVPLLLLLIYLAGMIFGLARIAWKNSRLIPSGGPGWD